MIKVQTIRRFGEYPGNGSTGIPTAKASYEDGYKTGLTWSSPWVPGGPWICSISEYERTYKNTDWIAFCDATVENNSEWRRGWADAMKSRQGELFL